MIYPYSQADKTGSFLKSDRRDFSRILSKSVAALMLCGSIMACSGGGTNTDHPKEQESAPAELAAPAQPLRKTLFGIEKASINEPLLRQRIATLASDEFEGRAPATSGGTKTRNYLVQEMKAIGLNPGNGDSYEQEVPLVELTANPETSSFAVNGQPLEYGPEVMFWTKKVTQNVSFDDSEMVFVGYGVVAPEYGWDDYAGLDVAGKTVVMLVNDPGYATQNPDLFNGRSMTYYGRWTYKFEEAARQGAAAAIVIHQTAPASYGWGVVSGSWSGPQLDLERPDAGASRVPLEGWVQESVARDWFTRAGLDFDAQIKAASSGSFKPAILSGLTANGEINNTIRRSNSANVVGVIPGTTRPDEYILYMGHWDHLGTAEGSGDVVSNGAVDNATGTAGILSIAEAFLGNSKQPERSVMFLAVTAEESGLLGSAYFGESPLVPFKNIVGGINIDAILPTPLTKDIIVIGHGSSELEDLMELAAAERGLYLRPDAEPEKGFFYRSDHISLSKKGVPMIYSDSGIDFVEGGEAAGLAFSAGYTKDHYHKPSDEYSPDWDMSGMVQSLELFYETGAMMAYTDVWPNWYEGNEFRAIRDAQRGN